MFLLGTAQWPDVVLALVASLPATLAAVLAYLNRRQIRTPSGDTIGQVAERTHDIKAREDRMRGALDTLAYALPNPGTSFKQWTHFVQRLAREGLGRDEPTNQEG